MYRFNPRTFRFSFHAVNEPNPHGGDFDYWGYHFATDATSGFAYQVRMDGGGKFKMHELLTKTVRPVPSSGILSSTHFPDEFNGNFIILNSIGFLGIKRYTLENTDGEFWGTEAADLLGPDRFRPSVSNRRWRVVCRRPHRPHAAQHHVQSRPSTRPSTASRAKAAHWKIVAIDGQPIEALLDVLKHPTNGVRLRARIELSERDTNEVIAATAKWIQQFDMSKKEDAHHLLEALWLHEQHNVVNEGLLTVLLNSPDPDARRAAERVKYMWEIEGRIRAASASAMDHMAMRRDDESIGDYFKQAPSP